MRAFVYDIAEYNNLIYAVSNNNLEIVCEGNGVWYYILAEDCSENVTDEIIYGWLSAELDVKVVDVFVDTNKERVFVIYN